MPTCRSGVDYCIQQVLLRNDSRSQAVDNLSRACHSFTVSVHMHSTSPYTQQTVHVCTRPDNLVQCKSSLLSHKKAASLAVVALNFVAPQLLYRYPDIQQIYQTDPTIVILSYWYNNSCWYGIQFVTPVLKRDPSSHIACTFNRQ